MIIRKIVQPCIYDQDQELDSRFYGNDGCVGITDVCGNDETLVMPGLIRYPDL